MYRSVLFWGFFLTENTNKNMPSQQKGNIINVQQKRANKTKYNNGHNFNIPAPSVQQASMAGEALGA